MRADLAKFAKMNPDEGVVKADRLRVEDIIKDTKAAIPEPTLEELENTIEFQEAKAKKRKRKQIIISVIVGLFVLVVFFVSLIVIKGTDYIKDSFIGHPTKELLQGDWVRSDYGYPSVAITTPKVLVRKDAALPKEVEQVVKDNQLFTYGSLINGFTCMLTPHRLSRNKKT